MKETYYVAGPMTGFKNYNFDSFDVAKADLVAEGYKVISPADLDRKFEFNSFYPPENWIPTREDQVRFIMRDLHYIGKYCTGIYLLKGWGRSLGARVEFEFCVFLDLNIRFQ